MPPGYLVLLQLPALDPHPLPSYIPSILRLKSGLLFVQVPLSH